jgi:hypothetical protein
MRKDVKPISRTDGLVVQDLNGEVLIYDLGENKAFCLNETSALVWQACNGEKNVSEISRELSQKLNSPANEDLIWLALDQLKKENLIENQEDFQIDFNGMSRRSVIKKVGLTVVVALPLVTSLVAPTAASAQSLVACGEACTNSDQCPTVCNNCISGGQGQTNRTCQNAGNAG